MVYGKFEVGKTDDDSSDVARESVLGHGEPTQLVGSVSCDLAPSMVPIGETAFRS